MNFVVLTAALSSANANLYVIVRTAFSLARAGFIPPSFGAVTGRGTPLVALIVSSVGLGAGVVVQGLWPATAYAWFFSVALFGGLFVWLMIFVDAHRVSAAGRLRWVPTPARRSSPAFSYRPGGCPRCARRFPPGRPGSSCSRWVTVS